MERKDRLKLMLLAEETIMAVKKSVEALDVILEKVFQSAKDADENLLREWAMVTGKMTSLYRRDVNAKHIDLLQLMALIDMGTIDRGKMVELLTERLNELEVTDE